MNTVKISNYLTDIDWSYDELSEYVDELLVTKREKDGAMAMIKGENFRKVVLAMKSICNELNSNELKKVELYDKMIADRRKGADAINAISAEERKARAKKAAAARWAKN